MGAGGKGWLGLLHVSRVGAWWGKSQPDQEFLKDETRAPDGEPLRRGESKDRIENRENRQEKDK